MYLCCEYDTALYSAYCPNSSYIQLTSAQPMLCAVIFLFSQPSPILVGEVPISFETFYCSDRRRSAFKIKNILFLTRFFIDNSSRGDSAVVARTRSESRSRESEVGRKRARTAVAAVCRASRDHPSSPASPSAGSVVAFSSIAAAVCARAVYRGSALEGSEEERNSRVARRSLFLPISDVILCESFRHGGTELREPQKIEKLGETYLPYSVFLEYINGLGTSTFAPGTYNLFKHNCNFFTEELSNFLVGKGIPKYILDLPEEILQTPVGQALGPLIETLSNSASAGFTVGQRFVEARIQREASPEYQLLNTAIEEARLNSIALEERRNVINEKLAKKDRKKKKKKKEKKEKGSKETTSSGSNSTEPSNCCLDMAENESAASDVQQQPSNGESAPAEMLPSERVMQMEEDEKREQEERKRSRDPPIVFKDMVNVQAEYEGLIGALEGKLNDEERTCMDELRLYVLENEGSWALGDNFLNFVGRVLYDKSLDNNARVKLMNVLSVAALKDDVILLLHQDRREHIIMNYAFDIDRHSQEEQLSLAQFLANMFENLSSSEWLLYISEWQHQNQNISNIRATTKVAVHSLLSNSEDLQIRGAAIIHNLACKEVKTVVFDDVAVELTMALLQYFNGSPAEEQLYACMKSLARFTQISGQEVPQLIQMIGPEPNKFRGTSQRIDEQIDQVNKKLR